LHCALCWGQSAAWHSRLQYAEDLHRWHMEFAGLVHAGPQHCAIFVTPGMALELERRETKKNVLGEKSAVTEL